MSTTELLHVTAPVSAIHPNPWNPNRMPPRVMEAERESIRAYGFIDPITVREHPRIDGEYEVIDGEHRWRAAQEEGYAELPLIVIPDLSDAAAKKLTVILNETRGEADVVLLGRLLADLGRDLPDDELRLGLPYSVAELAQLREIGDGDWAEFETGGDGGQPPVDVHGVALVFSSRRKLERFHRLVAVVQHEHQADGEAEAVLAALEREVARLEGKE